MYVCVYCSTLDRETYTRIAALRELQEWKKITQDEANKATESLIMLQQDMAKLQQEKAELERRVKDGVGLHC